MPDTKSLFLNPFPDDGPNTEKAPAEGFVPRAEFEKLKTDYKHALFYLGALQALIEDYLKDESLNA